ncbi:MAG TPA: glycosyltransferase family 4 protein [Candidatus Methylomirabilis sp.]|nr:glycosyltransferase family 4 protein [Candidatus Methylomirabilis sp.]
MGHRSGRLTVLYVSGHSDLAGGGQVSLLLLVRLLDKDRFLPLLLCPGDGEVARRAREFGAQVALLGSGGSIDCTSALLQALPFRRHVEARKADIVHCDTLYTALAAGIGVVGTGVPVIFHARSSETGGALDRLVPLFCTKIIAVSNAAARRFAPQARSKLSVIYNGVDLAEYRPGGGGQGLRQRLEITDDAFVLGYAGQLIKPKGLDVLIRAFARLRAEFATVKLLISGRGRDEAALRAMAGDGVRFLPFSDHMSDFYSALDVFVLPTMYAEGLSRSLIESMACGVPAVATPSGGNAEALVDGETGFFVPVRNEGALYGRLRDLYLAPEGRKRMGAAARRRAEQLFDAVVCTHAVEELYTQVCP